MTVHQGHLQKKRFVRAVLLLRVSETFAVIIITISTVGKRVSQVLCCTEWLHNCSSELSLLRCCSFYNLEELAWFLVILHLKELKGEFSALALTCTETVRHTYVNIHCLSSFIFFTCKHLKQVLVNMDGAEVSITHTSSFLLCFHLSSKYKVG